MVMNMQTSTTINEALESISRLSPDDQFMVAEIIRKRVIELRRQELAKSVEISRAEYKKGLTEHGSVDEFTASIKDDE
jgi:GTPase Era involved in 16S rRNA processing